MIQDPRVRAPTVSTLPATRPWSPSQLRLLTPRGELPSYRLRDRPALRWLRRVPADLPALLRSLLAGTVVFTVAVVSGGLLAAAEAADRPPAAPPASEAAPAVASTEQVFAQSMIYSGAVALALAILGMVMIARRRRLW